METDLNPELVCVDCGTDFRWNESDDDQRCAQCSAWHAWWAALRGKGANA